MKILCLTRLYRRLMLRYFGSTKAFLLFVCAMMLTAYLLDKLLHGRHESLVIPDDESNDVVTVGYNTSISLEELQCGVKQVCPIGKYPYLVQSGFLEDRFATICFRGKYYVGADIKHGRGINMVVINENTLEVEEVKIFDTFESDEKLKNFLSVGIKDYRVILMATEDDASKGLSPESRSLLHGYGSDAIHKVQYRENIAMVGQKGLTRGTAIEQHWPKSRNRLFGEMAEVRGCLSVPVGRVFSMNFKENVKVNNSEANCGIMADCGSNAFSLRLYSGLENRILPQICIDGKYVLEEAGRGINVVIFNPQTKSVINATHFDTWETNCDSLVPLLRSMQQGDMVMVVTHDEPTRYLTQEMKAEFELLGSSYIRRLAMRDSWAFVGQKGITGRSSVEELEFAPTGGGSWSNSVDKKLCVPLKIEGFSLKFDVVVDKNARRDNFCSRFVGFGDFCTSENRLEALKAAPLLDKTMEKSEIFNVPILIAAGINKNIFRKQLEAVLSLPGINQKVVKVFFYDSFEGYSELVSLFGFTSVAVTNGTTANGLLKEALNQGWVPNVKYVIVLDEEVLPTADFLSFMDQCLATVDADESVIGVSAWNDNGYVGPSNNVSLAYRVETFPGLGFMLKQSFYNKYLRGNWSQCCENRSWEGWLNALPKGLEMVIPEISRVTHEPYDGISGQSELRLHLFNRRRTFSNGKSHKIFNSGLLSKIAYEKDLKSILKVAVAVNISDIKVCNGASNPELLLRPTSKRKVYAIFYEQQNLLDENNLLKLCQCFELFSIPGYRARGLHRGLVRFSYGENGVFLIGSASDYYSFKPSGHLPLKTPSMIKSG